MTSPLGPNPSGTGDVPQNGSGPRPPTDIRVGPSPALIERLDRFLDLFEAYVSKLPAKRERKTTKKGSETDQAAKDLADLALVLARGDVSRVGEIVADLSSFEGQNGPVRGKSSIEELKQKPKWLFSTLKKARERADQEGLI